MYQKGFTPIVLFIGIILGISVAAGVFYLGRLSVPKSSSVLYLDNSKIPTPPPYAPDTSVQASPAPTLIPDSNGDLTFTSSYGAYELKYPNTWKDVTVGGDGGLAEWMELNPRGFKFTNYDSGYSLIYFGRKTDISQTKPGAELIPVSVRGIPFVLIGDMDLAEKNNYPKEQIRQVMQGIAATIKPLNVISTCKSPALVPLTDFPNNFTLSNYHDSDQKDHVTGAWPYASTRHFTNDGNQDSTGDSYRAFMLTYVKDGNVFSNPNKDFLNGVTPIHSVKTPGEGGFDQDGTDIWHINCIDTEEDGPGFYQPFHIGENDKDIFAIHLYGASANPTKLWGNTKWNINLLKSARQTVYIKMGNNWQKYTAKDYFATVPAAYGGKPAIYLYPTKEENISVQVYPQGSLIKTDHLYNPQISGWKVSANPQGIINNQLDSLYYEALIPIKQPEKGYVVNYDDLFRFSEDYVKKLGLNQNETQSFINFWKNKLPKSPYYFVSHLDQQTIKNIYPLTITPTPDTLLRVEIYFKPLQNPITTIEPEFSAVLPRNGFTAVEWGGILDGI